MKNFFAISNQEINQLPEVVVKGMVIQHQHSDGHWEDAVIQYGKNQKGEETSTIGFYTLTNKIDYIACIQGKLLSRPTLRLKIDQPSKS